MKISVGRKRAQALNKQSLKEHARRRKAPCLPLLDLPEDLLTGGVRVVAAGEQVLLENTCGLIELGDTCVRIATRQGEMSVEGDSLLVCDLRPDSMCVRGAIHRVSWPGCPAKAGDPGE